MKLKNILISGLGVMALASCNDYLDVEAPSKYTTDYVYSNPTAINTALNGLYTKVLNDNAWGKTFIETLCLNSDVDFKTNSSANSGSNNPRRFDCDNTSGTANGVWNNAYSAIDAANLFISNVENSDLINGADSLKVRQMLGEAKCIRAMFYNELVTYFGDVPAPFVASVESDNVNPDMQSRDNINWTIIQDLLAIAPKMKKAVDLGSVERFSQEAAYALVARIAMQAGGYSLRHNADDSKTYGYMARPAAGTLTDLRTQQTHDLAGYTEFYQIARDAAKKVIDNSPFGLRKEFKQVFIDECNYRGASDFDDAVMEIPFAKLANGNIGYLTGPKMASNNGATDHNWGESGGSLGLNHFYPYSFEDGDKRIDYIKGMWQYTYQTIPSLSFSYTWYNNKWSKLWMEEGLGNQTGAKTGINYPYIRYADVLLMFAEADNELNGPNADNVDAVNQVRRRAFGDDSHMLTAPASKEDMLDAILAERAKEFAGENMRWKDLVRNNKYSEEIFWTFMRYFDVANNAAGTYDDLVEEHDGKPGFYSKDMPQRMYWCYIKNPGDLNFYPQTSSAIPVIYAIAVKSRPRAVPQTYIESLGLNYTVVSQKEINSALTDEKKEWNEAVLSWDNDGVIKGEIRNSLFGYIRSDENDKIYIIENGTPKEIDPYAVDTKNLPVVRYLLPIPREAITRSAGAYINYYGY